jgi:hypothetical protein
MSASASERTTVVSMRAMRPIITPVRVPPWFFLKVVADALFQVARLAHVEQLALGV